MKTTMKILFSSLAVAAGLAASLKLNANENPGLKGTIATRELQTVVSNNFDSISRLPSVQAASITNFRPTSDQALSQFGTVKPVFTPTSDQALAQFGTVKPVFTPTSVQALAQFGTVTPVFIPTSDQSVALVSTQSDAISPFIP